MRSYFIDIPSVDKLRELVRIVNQFPCDVNLKNGLGCIDCKSLLGVLQMGPSPNIALEIIGEDADCDALENELAAVFRISFEERDVNYGWKTVCRFCFGAGQSDKKGF